MWRRLQKKYHLSVRRCILCNTINTSLALFDNRDTVMMLLALIDPSGSHCRIKHRLRRRVYHSEVTYYLHPSGPMLSLHTYIYYRVQIYVAL